MLETRSFAPLRAAQDDRVCLVRNRSVRPIRTYLRSSGQPPPTYPSLMGNGQWECIMPANDYRFVTKWRLPGTVEQVSDVIGDTDTLIRVWPSLYSTATVIEPG